MSYKPLAAEADAADIEGLLRDLGRRKEFYALKTDPPGAAPPPPSAPLGGFVQASATASATPSAAATAASPLRQGPPDARLALPGMNLHGAQIFVGNFFSPSTPYQRLLIAWQTGTGKTIGVVNLSRGFVRSFRNATMVEETQRPTVFVIGFTKSLIIADMLRFPELGFVTHAEVEEMKRLLAAAQMAGASSNEARQFSGYLGMMRRKITDRTRGSYYKFYGYKEFVNRLFPHHGEVPQDIFATGESLREAIRTKTVSVNTDLLVSMQGGLLICDEIHNVYNMQAKNNYGAAIQFVLDQPAAPRAVFMSATPMTGSAAEIIDLLNMLVPLADLPGGVHLRRDDFFADGRGSGTSRLLPGALERIRRLAAGRVSFLLDNDAAAYPKRVLEGEATFAQIPYLRFTACEISPFQIATIRAAGGAAPHTLHDVAFPNPDSDAEGLYESEETVARLSAASDEWRTAHGVVVLRGGEAGVAQGTAVISGLFLRLADAASAPETAPGQTPKTAPEFGPGQTPKTLDYYSAKYAKLMREVIQFIRTAPGKGVIFHPRVRMSGVLLIQEVLRMNGVLDELSNPNAQTLCAVCGRIMLEHDLTGSDAKRGEKAKTDADSANGAPAHTFTPARFLMAHSDIEHSAMERNISRFNAPSNRLGYQFRFLVGSKIISESYTLMAGQRLWVCACPTDISTLMQTFGRVVRRFSHRDLPPEQRAAVIRILVSVQTQADKINPLEYELERYAHKMSEYIVIQEVMRALQECAVDAFANYGRISGVVPKEATLDALPYRPLVELETLRRPPAVATFEAYGFGETEVHQIARIVHRLFDVRSVWTYEDLWGAVRSGAVGGVAYDVALFAEGNFQLALRALSLPRQGGEGAPGRATVVAYAPPYYVRCPARPGGGAVLDVGAAQDRYPAPARAGAPVRLSAYLRAQQRAPVPTTAFSRFAERYAAEPEMSLVEVEGGFHVEVMRALVAKTPVGFDEKTAELFLGMYRRAGLVRAGPAGETAYATRRSMVVFDEKKKTWREASHASFGVGRRHAENEIVVGYTVDAEIAAKGQAVKFKIRPPLRKSASRRDGRRISRGAVCETVSREKLRKMAAALARSGAAASGSSASKEHATAASLCDSVKKMLLRLELAARAGPRGMQDGARWLYLFADVQPVLT